MVEQVLSSELTHWVVGAIFICSLIIIAMSWIAKKDADLVSSLVIGAICLLLIIFEIAPRRFGYGHVPSTVEGFSKRLEAGIAYQVASSSKEADDNYVVIVRKFGTSDIMAIRVKSEPPKNFTLVNGKPVDLSSNQKQK